MEGGAGVLKTPLYVMVYLWYFRLKSSMSIPLCVDSIMYICVCMYVCMYVRIYMYVCTYVRIYIYIITVWHNLLYIHYISHLDINTISCVRRLLHTHTHTHIGARGGAVVEALRYKPKGRGIDSRWCHWKFSLTESFRPHYGPGVDSASNRNEYQGYFLGVKAAGA
jgi:hypothetical protein